MGIVTSTPPKPKSWPAMMTEMSTTTGCSERREG
jgi:hypothetical protein